MKCKITLSIKYVAAENLLTKNVFHIISATPAARGRQGVNGSWRFLFRGTERVFLKLLKLHGLCTYTSVPMPYALLITLIKTFNKNQKGAAKEAIQMAITIKRVVSLVERQIKMTKILYNNRKAN